MRQLMKIADATIAWLLLFLLVVIPASARSTATLPSLPTSLPSPTVSLGRTVRSAAPALDSTASTLFLPTVAQHVQGPPPSVECPFSLQIAALHQVAAAERQGQAADALSQASWLLSYEEAFPTLVEALKESGACGTRLRIDWALIQPNPPPALYEWESFHDEKLRLVAATGVQVLAHVDSVPGWAGSSAYGPIDPGRLDEFAQFLSDLVRRYKEPPYNIHHWELFNEPDQTVPAGSELGWGLNGDEYAEMLAWAYPAIKSADPEATVLMGGLAHDRFYNPDPEHPENGGPFYRYFPDEVMAAGGAETLDALNFHYFPDFYREWERWDPSSDERLLGWLPAATCGDLFDGQGDTYEAGGIDLIAKTTHYRNRLLTCYGVDRPIWVTELGEHGYRDDPDSLIQQARYVIQGHARGLAAGAVNITWFVLVSPPYDPHQQGLLYEHDWSPKPAYYAYQTLTSELTSTTYGQPLEVPGVEGYVFHDRYGQEKTVAWWAEEWPPSGSLTVAPASRLRVVDRMGTVNYVDDGGPRDLDGILNDAVTLAMTQDPVIVSVQRGSLP